MIPLYQNQTLREFETRLYTDGLCEPNQLMENAGRAAFEAIQTHWPQARHLLVCCGRGNNGGDGLIVARLASEQGWQVEVLSTASVQELTGSAAYAAQKTQAAGVNIQLYQPNISSNIFSTADVIVDALLGSGLQDEVREPYLHFINAINSSHTPVLSIDVPSGLDPDTGQVLGCAVQADVTITFIALKQGLLTGKSSSYCGRLLCNNIGVPMNVLATLAPSAEQLTWADVKHFLPRRKRSAHKGDYGHVLVIGGDYGMGGAVRMAAEAAMRVGAGLVSVATRPEHVPIVSCSRPEIMCHQINHIQDLSPLLAKATVVVIGPGFGKSEWAKSLLNKVLQQPMPKVMDADALNILAEQPVADPSWVLTPHPGEAARLLHVSNQVIQQNRFHAVQELQRRYQGVAVLKGAGTIIQIENHLPLICTAGNPGMASGGMGDILSGVIGGLLAQHLTLAQAAQFGVMIHALAADRAAEQGGGERGLLATDLLGYLRELVNPF